MATMAIFWPVVPHPRAFREAAPVITIVVDRTATADTGPAYRFQEVNGNDAGCRAVSDKRAERRLKLLILRAGGKGHEVVPCEQP